MMHDRDVVFLMIGVAFGALITFLFLAYELSRLRRAVLFNARQSQIRNVPPHPRPLNAPTRPANPASTVRPAPIRIEVRHTYGGAHGQQRHS